MAVQLTMFAEYDVYVEKLCMAWRWLSKQESKHVAIIDATVFYNKLFV
jgi:hypothetical protein